MTKPTTNKKHRPPLVIRSRAKGQPIVGVRPEGLDVIERLAANGNSRATIAKALGTSEAVLSRLIKEVPEIADAFDAGKGQLHDELVGLLLGHAREGNVTAAIFASKALLGFRDVGDPEHKKAPPPNVVINLPGAVATPGDWAKIVEATPVSVHQIERNKS